jgi:hypothetical protein
MTTLVNGISFCAPTTGTKDLTIKEKPFVYPNPFYAQIYLNSPGTDTETELVNLMGQIIFSGKHIERQNFSNLVSGTYFLRVMGELSTVIKLEKR